MVCVPADGWNLHFQPTRDATNAKTNENVAPIIIHILSNYPLQSPYYFDFNHLS